MIFHWEQSSLLTHQDNLESSMNVCECVKILEKPNQLSDLIAKAKLNYKQHIYTKHLQNHEFGIFKLFTGHELYNQLGL